MKELGEMFDLKGFELLQELRMDWPPPSTRFFSGYCNLHWILKTYVELSFNFSKKYMASHGTHSTSQPIKDIKPKFDTMLVQNLLNIGAK